MNSHLYRTLGFAIVMFMAGDGAARADLAPRDSSAFAFRYAGDEIWNGSSFLNGWTLAGGATTAALTLEGPTLVVRNDANNGWLQQDTGSTPWELGSGSYTVEISARLTDAAPKVDQGLTLWAETTAGGNANRQVLWLTSDSLRRLSGDELLGGIDNSTAFRTLRLAYDAEDLTAGANGTYHVWWEGVNVSGAGLARDATAGASRLIVGDCCTSIGNPVDQFEIAYVRYDTSGAFAPAQLAGVELVVDVGTGAASLTNSGAPLNLEINGYALTSAASLQPAGWRSLQRQGVVADPTPGNPRNGDSWEEFDEASGAFLGEGYLLGGSQLAAGEAWDLGRLFRPGSAQDLQFSYTTVTAGYMQGAVRYVASGEWAADFNVDGGVDGQDLARWEAAFGAAADADAEGDGASAGSDLLVWQRQFGVEPPAALSTKLPEPTGGALASLAIGAAATCRQASRRRLPLLACALAAIASAPRPATAQLPVPVNVFVGGQEGPQGTAHYRIPGLVVATDGSLLAFAEGRRTATDPGQAGLPIDMVVKRSVDGGATWGPLTVLQANPAFDYSDPRPVVDERTGLVQLLYAQWPDACGQDCVPGGLGNNSSVTLLQTSADDGATWGSAINLNPQVKEPAWRALNPGPGAGIQLRWQTDSARNGRLLVPAHRDDGQGFDAVALFSDDGGATWQAGGASQGAAVNESEVVELTNGDLLWDGRTFSGATRSRFLSQDGGATWTSLGAGDVPVTRVDASLIRWTARREGDDRDRLLFVAPLGAPAGAGNSRNNIGVWTSYDEGRSFVNPVPLQEGFAAYSVAQRLPGGDVGVLFEATGSTLIQLVRFDAAFAEGAVHPAELTHYDGFGNPVDPLRGGVGWSGAWTAGVAEIRTGALEFPGYYTAGDQQHLFLDGGRVQRSLGQATVDLNAAQDVYFSLFVNQEAAAGGNDFLELLLQDDAGATHAAFGVGNDDAFFVSQLGGTVASAPSAALTDRTYLVLAKLAVAGADAVQGDQLLLAWYDDPAAVPAATDDVAWQLVGGADENSAAKISQLAISTGGDAQWRIDGLRIGASLASVLVDTGVQLPPILGDLNNDRRVDVADWSQFRRQMNAVTDALAPDDRLRAGDFDGSGRVDLRDFARFENLFDAANGSGAFAALRAVPEPLTDATAAWCLLAWSTIRKRR